MTTLFVAATVATSNQAAGAADPRVEDHAAQIGELSTLDDMQALMELAKANRAVEAELKARLEEQAALIGQLTSQVDALKQQQQPIAAAPVVAEEKGGAVWADEQCDEPSSEA